ncbi:thioesterase II family protein [Aquirhabdus sp.]|uniref:thioesterase II family protein n=1 Tax=Aquirhabdus sp. TaxID=2824160 RepID=UPI00396C70E9
MNQILDLSRFEVELFDSGRDQEGSSLKKIRIFFFHHAGGCAQSYISWRNCFPEHWDIVAVEYPGREHADALRHDMNDLVSHLIQELSPALDQTYALFGHSMGSLVAYEFAQQVALRGLPKPIWLGVSGRYAPHLPSRIGYAMHQLSDAALLNHILAMGGTPLSVIQDVRQREHFLKVMRADFKVCETYQISRDYRIDIPISGFYGNQDAMVTEVEMNAWQALTTSSFRNHEYHGGHFYLSLLKRNVAEQITRDIVRYSDKSVVHTSDLNEFI